MKSFGIDYESIILIKNNSNRKEEKGQLSIKYWRNIIFYPSNEEQFKQILDIRYNLLKKYGIYFDIELSYYDKIIWGLNWSFSIENND